MIVIFLFTLTCILQFQRKTSNSLPLNKNARLFRTNLALFRGRAHTKYLLHPILICIYSEI